MFVLVLLLLLFLNSMNFLSKFVVYSQSLSTHTTTEQSYVRDSYRLSYTMPHWMERYDVRPTVVSGNDITELLFRGRLLL